MVNGLQTFQRHFAAFQDTYLLIGGCACDIHFEAFDLPFRATKDLDIVLCVEALSDEFLRAFWQFVRQGGYETRQRGSGGRQFYRFAKPARPDYPYMLELFSRQPGGLSLAEDVHLTPIPADGDVSSLSAILLNEEYYRLLMQTRMVVNGICLASAPVLLVLKAKAWLDLSARRASGGQVDAKDIRKHRNDIARLAAVVPTQPIPLTPAIADDMAAFLRAYADDLPDPAALGVPMTSENLLHTLRTLLSSAAGA